MAKKEFAPISESNAAEKIESLAGRHDSADSVADGNQLVPVKPQEREGGVNLNTLASTATGDDGSELTPNIE